MDFREVIAKALENRGMSKRGLALKLGMTAQQMNDITNRHKSVGVGKFASIIEALGYEIVIRDKISGKEIGVLEDKEAE